MHSLQNKKKKYTKELFQLQIHLFTNSLFLQPFAVSLKQKLSLLIMKG